MLYQGTAPFFENKSTRFCEAFSIIFGEDIRDEYDILCITRDFSDLMWQRVGESLSKKRTLSSKDIARVRGGAVLTPEKNVSKHHWPPSSRGGQETIRVPDKFHCAWHDVFMNLYKQKEFEIFWEKMFYLENIAVRDIIDRSRKEALWFDFKKKKK